MNARVLLVQDDFVWLGKGRHLEVMRSGSNTGVRKLSLDCGMLMRVILHFGLLCRLFRLGFHHLVKLDNDVLVVFFNKEIHWIDLANKETLQVEKVRGSRPLLVTKCGSRVIYGEYFSNPNRVPVRIWSADMESRIWSEAFQIGGVRHIHGISFDPFDGAFWITTGDDGDEARILRTDTDFAASIPWSPRGITPINSRPSTHQSNPPRFSA